MKYRQRLRRKAPVLIAKGQRGKPALHFVDADDVVELKKEQDAITLYLNDKLAGRDLENFAIDVKARTYKYWDKCGNLSQGEVLQEGEGTDTGAMDFKTAADAQDIQ